MERMAKTEEMDKDITDDINCKEGTNRRMTNLNARGQEGHNR